VDELEASGDSVSEFAARQGLSPRTLAWWRWRLRQDAAGTTEWEEPVFVPVSVAEAPEAAPSTLTLEAVLPNGVQLRLERVEDVRGLVAALGAL